MRIKIKEKKLFKKLIKKNFGLELKEIDSFCTDSREIKKNDIFLPIKGKNLDNNRNTSLIKVLEEGALFKSYIDGSNYLLTPEKSIEIQRELGSDIILVFDECTPFNVDKTYTANSMQRSHRWAKRSLNNFNNNKVLKKKVSKFKKIVLKAYPKLFSMPVKNNNGLSLDSSNSRIFMNRLS